MEVDRDPGYIVLDGDPAPPERGTTAAPMSIVGIRSPISATAQHLLPMILCFHKQLECCPMPNVMAAVPNIGGALCSTPQSLADAHY